MRTAGSSTRLIGNDSGTLCVSAQISNGLIAGHDVPITVKAEDSAMISITTSYKDKECYFNARGIPVRLVLSLNRR